VIDRVAHVNGLIGKPYKRGGAGPVEYDCYSLTRHLQATFWSREMPVFETPAEAGRFALAAMISRHPERQRWHRVERPEDGAIVSMAKQEMGYHMGTYLEMDGGLLVHTLETSGVVADKMFALAAFGWRNLKFYLPA
jgi:hypothetical protein